MRRACRVLGQRRASVYYKPRRVNEDDQIADRLKVLTMRHLNWAGPTLRLSTFVQLSKISRPLLESQEGVPHLPVDGAESEKADQTQKDQTG